METLTISGKPVEADSQIPFYLTEEYEQAMDARKQEEQKEAGILLASIEAFQEKQEIYAVEQFQNSQKQKIEDFQYYKIPKEYRQHGGSFSKTVQKHLYGLCQAKGVDFEKAVALIETESGYKSNAMGKAEDTGYMQIIPQIHKDRMKRLGCTDMADPIQNMEVGIDLLSELLGKYGGDYKMAFTAYQCGPGGADKHWFSRGIKASPYAKTILKKAVRIRKELDEAENQR